MPADPLILNSPYAAPTRHWQPGAGGALVEVAGRRPASYEIFDIRNNTRRSEPLDKVNEIRGRVEGAPEFRQGIFLPGDGGPWERVCCKMATGTGKTLVLEIKGEDSEQNRAKRAALDAWVQAVNAQGGFGLWCWDVAFQPAQLHDILRRHASGHG